ncbi:hypothetical protein HX052_10740 [Myroides marinus]|uniref:hypothetical protein n=1 Tax=Myroides marinus TaxID=703342 RepID=UPI002576AF71|nr:hypothetical protein [Myroides marinus]MDM1390435.1 hypothetical protein [Myroides marinus]
MLCFSVTYGQVNKTVGTRITDVTTDKALRTNAILDLESTSKGFFLPRMTTLQRDAIKKEMGKDNGLAVYNIDNDCVEYWSEQASKWMSLCGTLPPAKLDLAEDSCQSISFSGFDMSDGKPLLQQGVSLNPTKQYMVVRLKVNQVGTYTISASSQNGYFFSGEGQFQAIGTYEVILKGMGTPVKGYDQNGAVKGDKLQFIVNGIDSKVCIDTELLVKPADLDFIINKALYKAKGTYNVGVAASLKKGNSIEIDIKVNAAGQAIVTATNKTLGLTFMASKKIDSNDTKLVLELVEGENIPKQNDSGVYELDFEVNTKKPAETINNSKAQVEVEKTQIKAIYEDVNLGKEPYYQGDKLNVNHTIELPFKVINSGKTSLSLSNGQELMFKSDNIMLSMPSDDNPTQLVQFSAVKGVTLPNTDSVKLTLKADAKYFEIVDGDVYNLPLDKKPVAYTIDCNSVKSNRGAIPYNQPIGDSYYITAKVNVTVVGEYEINTTMEVDGIIFSTTKDGVKQVFTKTGTQEVTLYAVDKTIVPTNRGEYSVNLKANDKSEIYCSGIKVKVGYQDINILLLKSDPDNQSLEALFFTGKNKDGQSRFGENGVFAETGTVNVTTYDLYNNNTQLIRNTIAKDIRAKKYNFIMTIGEYGIRAIDKNITDALYDYTINNDGIFLMLTTFYHYNNNVTKNYIDAVTEYIISIGAFQSKEGLELIKKFNQGKDVVLTNYATDRDYNMTVHDFSNPLTSVKKGYEYHRLSGTKYKNIHWYYAPDIGNRLTLNAEGTRYKAIVTDRKKLDRGLVFTHRDYPNLIWAPVGSSWFSGLLNKNGQADDKTGEPYKEDYNGRIPIETDTAPFATNLYIELISRLANK